MFFGSEIASKPTILSENVNKYWEVFCDPFSADPSDI